MTFGERKMHILEKMHKVQDEATLAKIEKFMKTIPMNKKFRYPKWKEIAGLIPKEAIESINKTLEEENRKFFGNDWK